MVLGVSKLSELLKSQPLSAKQASVVAEERNIHLPYGTIAAYWAGSRHGRPSHSTLTALAEVTGIPLPKLQQAAWGMTEPLGAYTPPEEAHLMDARQRRLVDELIRVVVASNGASNEPEQPAHSGTSPQPGTPGEARQNEEAGLLDDTQAANRALREMAGTAKGAKGSNARRKLGHR